MKTEQADWDWCQTLIKSKIGIKGKMLCHANHMYK